MRGNCAEGSAKKESMDHDSISDDSLGGMTSRKSSIFVCEIFPPR